jgi:hypothetical protein
MKKISTFGQASVCRYWLSPRKSEEAEKRESREADHPS